jgi:phospholipase C
LHELSDSRASLVYDIQELYRWLVDLSVIQLLEEKKLKKSNFIITENYHIRLRESTAKALLSKISLNLNKTTEYKGKNYSYEFILFDNVRSLVNNIADLMEKNKSISWKYYDFPFYVPYNISTVKYNLWNPFASQARNYQQDNQSHFVLRTEIFTDIKNHTLPNVSYVIPSTEISEHPPYNVTYGMYWTSSVVDAVMNSSYWNHTVIIITWDDYGGEFYTISPPQVDRWGYGVRVPAIVISPYSKAGYVDNTTYAFESVLKFIEWRYNMSPLTRRDSIANDIVDSLNLNQTPAKPHPVPLTKKQLNLISQYLNETPTED